MRPLTKKATESRPLPPGWEEWYTSEGRAYYIDHNTKSKTWTAPSVKRTTGSGLLPPGWEEWHTSEGTAYYIDHNTTSKTWTAPSMKRATENRPLPPGWEEWHTTEGTAYYVDHNTNSKTRTAPSVKRATESRPLPPGWEEWHTSEGMAYYIDHNRRGKTWTAPSVKRAAGSRPLPPGWEEWHTSEGRAYYIDHNRRGKTWTAPPVKRATESRQLPPGWEEWHTSEGMAYYFDHNTKSTTWKISTSRVLQCLYSLDTSSPDFFHNLYYLIRYDEDEQYLTSLQGSELTRLVDFLDKVHPVPPAFRRYTKQTPQALGAIPTTDGVARGCLNKLQEICGHHTILPSSYIASGQIARVGDGPVALGVTADAWEGTYRGKKVSIRCLKIRTENYRILKKVRIRYDASSSRLLKNTCGRCSHSSKSPSPGEG